MVGWTLCPKMKGEMWNVDRFVSKRGGGSSFLGANKVQMYKFSCFGDTDVHPRSRNQ